MNYLFALGITPPSSIAKIGNITEYRKNITPKVLIFLKYKRRSAADEAADLQPLVLYLNWVLLHHSYQLPLFLNLYPEGVLKTCIDKTTIIQDIINSFHLLIKVFLVKC